MKANAHKMRDNISLILCVVVLVYLRWFRQKFNLQKCVAAWNCHKNHLKPATFVCRDRSKLTMSVPPESSLDNRQTNRVLEARPLVRLAKN